jgi:hypothetical protein
MTTYKIGETVKTTKNRSGVIRAIFTATEGRQCYAIENDGALDFIDEEQLSGLSQGDLAAA